VSLLTIFNHGSLENISVVKIFAVVCNTAFQTADYIRGCPKITYFCIKNDIGMKKTLWSSCHAKTICECNSTYSKHVHRKQWKNSAI